MANASRRAGRRKGIRARTRQVFGAVPPAALSFSSMHLFTRSARLSRSSWALAFSVRIQHSRAARARVIGSGSAAGSAGFAACVLAVSGLGAVSGLLEAACALGASAAAGPVPSVSQAVSVSAAASTARLAAARILRTFEIETFIHAFQTMICGSVPQRALRGPPAARYLPELTLFTQRLRNRLSQLRAQP